MRIKAKSFHGTLSAVLMLASAGCYTSAENLDAESMSSEPEADADAFEDKLLAGCGDTLAVSEFLASPNGQYRLYMQGDGNLVLRNVSTKKALWASGTNGKGAVKLVLQTDGNLALYTSSGKSVWGTGTAGKGSNALRLNDNGSLVLYAGSTAVWSANGSSSLSSSATANSQLCSSGTVVNPPPPPPPSSASISHVGTKSVYDFDGQGLSIARPSGVANGDLLVLILHRTDDYLPLKVDGWTRAAECYKRDNGYQCATAADCTSWSANGKFCNSFGSTFKAGQDLAQSIFYKTASNEPSSYQFNLNQDSSGHPGWAILTALRGAATTNPVRAWANKGCDNTTASLFPSVHGQAGDMLLLSQSFDDNVQQSAFGPPNGTTLFGFINGNSGPAPDETGFLFGKRLTSTGNTGEMRTSGVGGSGCKDALVSLTIKPQ